MIKLTIDGVACTGELGESILDIARRHHIQIPTFCHSEELQEFGACGLCVVESEGSPKLLRSCATQAGDGMKINTKSPRVLASRKTALELLISDHDGDCIAPCTLACPAQTDCQAYIGLVAAGAYGEALRVIKQTIPLPASIGRVCPHPCETMCRRRYYEAPVNILHIKRFAADCDLYGDRFAPKIPEDSGKRVAIIGAGSAGLSAAYFLRQNGHGVTIFDAMPLPGGMLRYGIP